MLAEFENVFQVFCAVVVIAFMLVVAVTVVVLCGILLIPVAIYQAVSDPFNPGKT